MLSIREKLSNFPRISHSWLYGGLVLGFLFKSIGASWDVSYHFKHFRDLLQLPHIVNGFGDVVVIVLLCYLWLREPKQGRPQLKIIFYGIVVFIVGIIFDQWYHIKFGIDLTTWSPSHFTLYSGSLIALVGAFLYVLRDHRHGRISSRSLKVFGLIFLYLILDCFWFPLLQQEQGVITDYYLRHGVRLADPELLNLFFSNHQDVYGGLPGWLYGAWVVLCAVMVFKLTKLMGFHKFGATIVAGLYLVGRCVMNTAFSAINYPLSTLPYYLILVALIFDILYVKLEKYPLARDIITSVVPLAVIIILGLFNPEFPIHPPIPILQTFLFSIPAAVVGYIVAISVYDLLFRRQLS